MSKLIIWFHRAWFCIRKWWNPLQFVSSEPLGPFFDTMEEVAGNWHYHITVVYKNGQSALCGETHVMFSQKGVDRWGYELSHIPMTYCKKCEQIAPKSILPQ